MKTCLPKVLVFLIFITFLSPQNIIAQTTSVLINEVKTNTSGTNEFVELYNPTDSQITMTNWYLKRRNSVGTPATLVNNFTSTILAHGYFLIGHEVGYIGPPSLDIFYSAPSNSLTNNYSVQLYDNVNPSPIDQVGFGSSPNCEIACPSNPPANYSIERINHQDTNNNANDFQINNTPTPQNSSSTDTPSTSPSPSPLMSPSPTPETSPDPTATPNPSIEPTTEPSPTLIPSISPSLDPSPTTNPSLTPTTSPIPSPVSEIIYDGINIICTKTNIIYKIFGYIFYIPQIVCTIK